MTTDATTETPETPESAERRPLPYLTKVPGGVPDTDEVLREAADLAAAGDTPLLLRIQPELYFPERKGVKYIWTRWGYVRWHLALTEALALELKTDLDAFFQDWVRRKQGEQEGR